MTISYVCNMYHPGLISSCNLHSFILHNKFMKHKKPPLFNRAILIGYCFLKITFTLILPLKINKHLFYIHFYQRTFKPNIQCMFRVELTLLIICISFKYNNHSSQCLPWRKPYMLNKIKTRNKTWRYRYNTRKINIKFFFWLCEKYIGVES